MRLYPSVDMASWNIPEVNEGLPCWEDHRTKYSLLGASQQRSGFAVAPKRLLLSLKGIQVP